MNRMSGQMGKRFLSYDVDFSVVLTDWKHRFYRVFSHDVMVAILVSQNNEMAAMLVSQTSPLGVELRAQN